MSNHRTSTFGQRTKDHAQGYCKRTLAVVLSLRAQRGRRGQVSLQAAQVARYVSVRPAVRF